MLKSERGQVDAPAADDQAGGQGSRWLAARPFLAWGAALLVAAVVLFFCYLRESQHTAVNSDGAGMALQGWDMLHGNLLLSGWWLADVTFYTFEVPIDAFVEAVHGLNADAVHISAALIYTLLVLTAALLARGKARGTEGIVRAVLAAGILLAPSISPATRVLLLSPDHTGVGVPILLTLLLLDRAAERWWVAVAVGAMLTWAQVDDPLATYAAALPLALVCVVRAIVPLVQRRRPGWYDAGLAAAALISVELTRLVISAIKAAGGYSMQSLKGVAKIIPTAQWGHQIHATIENVLILFGADFFEQHGIDRAIAFLHFVGVALALAGVVLGLVGLVRGIPSSSGGARGGRPPRSGTDRVTQILTVAIGATLAAGTFATVTAVVSGAHEIALVLPFGAVLAGRTIGPWLSHEPFRWGSRGSSPTEQRWDRLLRITLAPVLGVALACYLAVLGYNASQPARPGETQGLADFLTAHHLTYGLGRYWAANSTTLESGGRVRVAAVTGNGKTAYPWVTKPGWYEPGQSYANFVVAAPGAGDAYAFSEAGVRRVFGKPARVYHYGPYVIMVWNKNLLLQMLPPNQSQGVH